MNSRVVVSLLPLCLFAVTSCQAQQSDVTVTVDVARNRHPISPLIYGSSFAMKDGAGYRNPLHRFGGNSTTRYNWKQNCDNRAADWFFQSIADKDPTPGAVVSKFIEDSRAAGSLPMLTVPCIGWVAKVQPDRSKLWSYSVKKYGPQEKTDSEWNPDSGNGKRPNGSEITGNDPNDANLPVTPEFFRPWVKTLASSVPYFVLDNEPALWQGTHRDVQPKGVTLDELFEKLRATAAMIKAEAPKSQVCGPEEWGWTGYLYSGADSQWASKNGWNPANLPDRTAHGGRDAMPYLLSRFAAEEKRTGKRLLDVFTLHFYPQGGEHGDDVSEQMQRRRNRSTRALWDPGYKDETWINETVKLIPRMKAWRDTSYPGTKLGLTEYSWGADNHINGATAQADILGILGREGLDLACRWVSPGKDTPTYKAFQLYRNADGKGLSFGDTSVSCTVSDPDDLAAFAATDSKAKTVTVMLVAKASSGSRVVRLAGLSGKARLFQLTAANKMEEKPAASLPGPLTISCPSVTLIVLPKK
jgi:hypothetical protein